jgi:hypothetical protein
MKEALGINPFRNDPSREKAERMAASRWAWGRGGSPLFADQISAPDPDGIVAEYSRKAEDWVEWNGASSSELTASGEFWSVECRPRNLPGSIRCEEHLATFARRVAIPQIALNPK